MTGRSWHEYVFVVAFAAFVAGCRNAASLPPAGSCPVPNDDGVLPGIEIAKKEARPNLVRILRDGDPRPAVAVVVQTGGGSYASLALASLLEARLQKAGFAMADSRADRDSFRLRTLVETPERAGEFVTAVRNALAGRVTPGSAELGLVGRRLLTLRRRPLEAPIAAAVTRCTGEIGVLASDPFLDLSTNEGALQLDALRGAAYGATQVAFAAVGAMSLLESVAAALHRGDAWPKASAPESLPPAEDQIGAFLSPERAPGTARITIAVPTRSADTAALAARRAGDVEGPLVARLRALAVAFRVLETRAIVRPRGGCLAVTLETARAYPSANLEDAAAVASTIARQELDVERASAGEAETHPSVAPWPLGLAGRSASAVRLASDPREAAELGALWSFTTPAPPEERQPLVLSLALPAPSVEPRESGHAPAAQPAGRRFFAALERLSTAWNTPLLDRRGRLERGQGELWLLLASPCGVLAEGSTESGATALALMAALAHQTRSSHGVALEPWIAPDGVGVLVHAARLPGESTRTTTVRIAAEAARMLAVTPFSAASLATARAALLHRVSDGVAPEGRALQALAGMLAPGHPSWLAPLGSWEELANAGADSASSRWAALVGGPLRLAVLANESEEQVDVAARAIDRWLVRTVDGGRACAPVETLASPKAGTIQVSVAAPAPLSQALVGFTVPPPGNLESVFGELLLAGLTGGEGWLAKALSSASLAATAQARLIGGTRAAALVIDIRGTDATLDAAVAQVRALLQRLRQGAIGPNDFERSTGVRDRWELDASLDPRRRIMNLWRDARASSPPPLVSLEAWKTWAASALSDEKLAVVLARPKR